MPTLLDRYPIDMSPVHRAEAIFGIKLPDLLAPVRTLDADVEAIRAQTDEYLAIADEIERAMEEITAARASYALEGETEQTADTFWDVVLAILKAIAGVIIALVGVLLLVIGALIRVIGELFSWIADALNWLQEMIFLAVGGVLAFILRGRAREIAMVLWRVFNKRALAIVGFVALASGAIGTACDYAGKGVMWLGYWLMEQGARLGGDDKFADGARKDRDKVFD